ncbi:hypothetical protein [Pasteurella multocida]|uniref:hypothetical protein n=1 Tax=Pasteurella multocida TaxID=747 RepID=UPI003B00C581
MEKGQKVKLRNGNDAEIVFISDFGKLLVVEYIDDELPVFTGTIVMVHSMLIARVR